MSEPTTHDPPPTTHEDEEISLLDLLIVLAKHKKLVLGLPLAAAAVAAIVSLLLPITYTATAKILPPQQRQSTAAAMLNQLGGLGGIAGQSLGIRNPNDLYVGMLKSRTVADNLIGRFELRKLYKTKTSDDTRKQLESNTKITAGRDGIIVIEFEDKEPKRAATIANAYVEELYKLTTSLAVTEASQRRLFFENQLKQTRNQLAQAEISLRQAINSKGLAGIDVQSRAILEPSAQLRAQIALREVQLSAIRIFATDQHPDIERLRHEVRSMRGELAKLEGGDGESKPSSPTSAGLENLRSLRDMKFLERLTELLTQQFEAAKIDEAKDTSIIQVLDKAVEPEKRSKPRRTPITILTAIVAGIIAVFWAFGKEALERAREDPQRAGRLRLFSRYLTGK